MKKIRLTESDLYRLIKESVRNILKEDYSYNGFVGSIGDEFDDDWDDDSERRDALENKIWKAIVQLAGGHPKRNSVMFRDLVEMLQRKFNFTYMDSEDRRRCHNFSNGQYLLTVFPSGYSENQGEMRIFNIHLS